MNRPHVSRRIFFCLCLLIGIPVVSTDILIPAIDDIYAGAGGKRHEAQLLFSSFLFSYGLLQVPAGALSDHFGRRPILFAGLFVFLLGALLASFATSAKVILLARFVQGIGGAICAMLARTIARDLRSGRELTRLMASLMAFIALLSMASPLAGGFIADQFGWRTVLIAVVLYGVITAVLIVTFLPETLHRHRVEESFFTQTAESFVTVLGSRVAIWSALLLSFHFFGYIALLSSFGIIAGDVYGLSATKSGLVFAIGVFFYFLSSLFARSMASRIGAEGLLALSAVIYAICALLSWRLVFQETVGFLQFCFSVLPYGIGFGLIFSSATSLAMDKLPQSAGFVSGTIGTLMITAGGVGAWFAARIYSGDVTSTSIILAGCSLGVVLLYVLGVILMRDVRPQSSLSQAEDAAID